VLHEDLQRLLTEADAAESDARTLVAGLSDAQGNWQPGGGWSVAQCLDHLAKINHAYMAHFLPVLLRARDRGGPAFAGLRLTWAGRWFIRTLEPPPRQKTKTFASVVPPASIPIADALAGYLASHEAYRRFVHAAQDVDVNRVGAQNPFVRVVRVRLSTVLCVPPAHDRRHLWQARQVLQAPGFPCTPAGQAG
jgi:hypothetical protein